jgi:single-strand DNA-binding protein
MSATIIAPGNITKDAVTRQAGSSTVVSFSVAVNCFERKEKVTRFYDCSWFGQRAVSLVPMLTKGSKVTVTGGHSTREHNGKEYQQIEVWNVELQGGRPGGQQQSAAPATSGGGFSDDDYAPKPTAEDDFPF